MRQFPISLSEEQYNKLKRRAKHSGCSIASIVRWAITDFFDKEGI